MSDVMSGLARNDVVVITGAAQGIGRAIALALAARSARLALWDIDEQRCAGTAAECAAIGAQAIHSRVDVSDFHQVKSAAELTHQNYGPVFGLVNNAGIFPRATILDSTPELWRMVLGVNLLGMVFCVQAIVPSMIRQNRGVVVNIASGRALQGTPRGAHYAASKAGIVSLTKSMAMEFGPFGIRSNAVIPGITETAQPLADTTLEELRARGAHLPLGRIGQPEDIADAVVFLLSDESRYITGQSIAVNGGAIMIP
jgi:NAD(P)-dependent dehydrogenase (short-subunit alcohol dehydrogenase family)